MPTNPARPMAATYGVRVSKDFSMRLMSFSPTALCKVRISYFCIRIW